ncbi:hypothetical protein J6350_24970, partial [Burkholderia pseudomallei]|nr:hypothetical protein [Burkholderia pseudomallei]MBO2970405.1 hypothetical protein [Burkholderia pseudomallei]MBO2971471.1 hypothetical protein [Burkholderia pseudomallei]MBO3053814.1 hypothetical protein [Burkholderia pseudomallei]MBO3061197.1 hypothetical protein [Burkholderia pseudomallei]
SPVGLMARADSTCRRFRSPRMHTANVRYMNIRSLIERFRAIIGSARLPVKRRAHAGRGLAQPDPMR